jgi:copper chaperone
MCSSHDKEQTGPQAGQTATAGGGLHAVYAVKGMTCNHCAASVTEEVEQVAGVTGIDVDLDGGRIIVRGDDFSDEEIRAAVDEAGYEIAAS